MEDHGLNTRAAHPPTAPTPAQLPIGLAVHRTSTFSFTSAQEYSDVLHNRAPGYTYSRIDNPTVDAFAGAVAALEGSGLPHEVTAQAFASGMAAISTALLTVLRAGDHVVASSAVYGGTYSLLRSVLPRFGVTTTFVDTADLDAVTAAIQTESKLVYVETIANPTMAVADLAALASIASAHGLLLAVDSTFASPAVCRPLEWGADLVLHSATKYLGGHSDVTGGVAVGKPDLIARIRELRCDLGGSLSPDDAFLLHRGTLTLPLRMVRHCHVAAEVARALRGDARLTRVQHPSLADHPTHDTAVRQFDDGLFGAVVTITPEGGRDAGLALCDGLRLVRTAASLGGVHSLASHVASTTHRQYDDAALLAAGIDPGAVRLSIGLEDPEDLIADIVGALG
jgi:cystathionine beta-lyase/cystathionine gamma-synthase